MTCKLGSPGLGGLVNNQRKHVLPQGRRHGSAAPDGQWYTHNIARIASLEGTQTLRGKMARYADLSSVSHRILPVFTAIRLHVADQDDEPLAVRGNFPDPELGPRGARA